MDDLRMLTQLSHDSLVLVPNSTHSSRWSSVGKLSQKTNSRPVCVNSPDLVPHPRSHLSLFPTRLCLCIFPLSPTL